MLKTVRRDAPKHSLCSRERVPECLISVRTIGEDVLGVARRSPADCLSFWWPSHPGSIFRRPVAVFAPNPNWAIFAGPIHCVSRAFGQGQGESASDTASASRHGSDLSTSRPASGKRNPSWAGNGDGVLQVPSALNKRPPPPCLCLWGLFRTQGVRARLASAPARVATTSWSSAPRRHLALARPRRMEKASARGCCHH